MNVVEVRCPVGPRKLFTKLKLGEEAGKYLPNNLIEFSCNDCSRRFGREHGARVRVFHQFNFLGELVRTTIDGQPEYATGLE